jgi:hypothetical protein
MSRKGLQGHFWEPLDIVDKWRRLAKKPNLSITSRATTAEQLAEAIATASKLGSELALL